MHPAISVIFFTVMSGAGFGFMAMLGLGTPIPQGPLSVFLISGVAGTLAVAGLLASTFHLGHPERALKAFSQWRTSWLSREGVLAVATLMLFAIYVLIWMVTGDRIIVLGLLVALGAAATVFATAMIYAQLKTVPQWHMQQTPLCYLLFAAVSGVLLAASFAPDGTIFGMPGAMLAMMELFIAWAAKVMWWQQAKKATLAASGSTVETATGLGHIGKARMLERPHTGENYLTKEMVHKIGRKHANKLRVIAMVLGCVIPVLICLVVLVTNIANIWLLLAFGFLMAGLFAERWLFFAEAEHSVSLYY